MRKGHINPKHCLRNNGLNPLLFMKTMSRNSILNYDSKHLNDYRCCKNSDYKLVIIWLLLIRWNTRWLLLEPVCHKYAAPLMAKKGRKKLSGRLLNWKIILYRWYNFYSFVNVCIEVAKNVILVLLMYRAVVLYWTCRAQKEKEKDDHAYNDACERVRTYNNFLMFLVCCSILWTRFLLFYGGLFVSLVYVIGICLWCMLIPKVRWSHT